MAVDKNGKNLPKGITRRKDGRYMARFQYEGENYTLYGTEVDKLLLQIEDLKYEVRHGLYEKEKNITVDSWYHTWMEEYKRQQVKPTTFDLYDRTYEGHIKPYIQKKKLKDIRPEHIQRILNTESKKVQKQTLTRIRVILNGIFQQAYKNGIIQKNPVERTSMPKQREEAERRVMTVEEQNTFLKYAKQTYYGDIFEVALSTGMRKGELLALEWSDIDFAKRMIHVTGTLIRTKGRYMKGTPKSTTSKRDIPMLNNVYEILKKRRKDLLELKMVLGDKWTPLDGLDNLVFTNEFGSVVTLNTMQYYMKHIQELIRRDGIEFAPIHVHTLRHTFATRAIEAGMQPQVLKTILGHSSLAMTMDLYSHVLPDTKAEEMEKIANLF